MDILTFMWVEKNLSIWIFYQLQANLILTNANTKNPKLKCWPWRQFWSSKECSHMRGWAKWRWACGSSILYVPILLWGGGRWTEVSREVWVSPRVGGLSWFFRQSLQRPCTSQTNKQTKKPGGCHFSPATRRQRKNACRWVWDVTLRFSGSWSSCP